MRHNHFKNIVYSFLVFCGTVGVAFFIDGVFNNTELIPAVFVLGVLIISLLTEGYIYGIIASIFSVFAVNFAFSFPYFEFDFTMTENIVSAVIMIIVTVITGSLTIALRKHEEMKAESEKEMMRANLLRAVSHDLRTPLTTILGASSTIMDNYESLTEVQIKELVRCIRDDSQWMSGMVENLLSVTKLDGGNFNLVKTPVVVEELVDSVLNNFSIKFPDVKVNVSIPEDLLIVSMDPLLIQQVLLNILNNAVFHAEGMENLFLNVYDENNSVVFEIADDGKGISHDVLKNIFNSSKTNIDAPADTKKNAGIGLSVCSTIIKAHGGVITAANRKEGGAVFSFALEVGGDSIE